MSDVHSLLRKCSHQSHVGTVRSYSVDILVLNFTGYPLVDPDLELFVCSSENGKHQRSNKDKRCEERGTLAIDISWKCTDWLTSCTILALF